MGEIRYIDKRAEEYPECLKYYERMPKGLYLKGNFPDPEKKTVAIVGARSCSSYGKKQALVFAQRLAEAGVQIISGMAYGIDTYAHQGALMGGGKTFAVLGCGVDICYPKENYLLYEDILKKGGGILSEYEPGTPPNAWHFPIRNRIISAMADLVLVVEARKKSGSLITADYALEQGKSVLAVPGRIGDSCSDGCNALIAQGAGIAWSPAAVLEELFPEWMEEGKKDKKEPEKASIPVNLSDEERLVLACLDSTDLPLESIRRASGLSAGKTSAVLIQLCMKGYAVSTVPGYYCLEA